MPVPHFVPHFFNIISDLHPILCHTLCHTLIQDEPTQNVTRLWHDPVHNVSGGLVSPSNHSLNIFLLTGSS